MPVRVQAAFIVIAGLIGAGSASAQVGGGVKVGVNFASVSASLDTGETKSMRTGLVAGGFLTIALSDMVGIQPEVLYSMEGTKLKFASGSLSIESTAKIDVVRVPLLLRVGPKPRSTASGFLVVGPSFGFIARAKTTTPNGPDIDFKDDLKSTDVALLFGGGVTFGKFLAEARYTAGMTDLNKTSSSDPNKSQVFSVLVGVAF
jgi:hypothetical protein